MEKIKLAYIRASWKLSNGSYWKAEDIKGDLLSDLNLSFARIDSRGLVQLDNKEYLKKQVDALHKTFPNLRINLSIGGWGAEGFSKAASTKKNRSKFVESMQNLIKEMDLNGVDIDWEFPVGPDWGQSIKSSPDDRENFILLLSEIKDSFNNEKKLYGKTYSLSAAIPSNSWFFEKNDIKSVCNICDYINLMCYDYYGSWSEVTGFNASLYTNPKDPVKWSSDSCISLLLKKGINSEKIVLGFPAYGFAWKEVPDNGSHGLFQKGKSFIGNFDYNQLEVLYGKGYEDFFDDFSKQSYRYNAEKKIFVNYPSSNFIKAINAYVKEHNLAGVMYWEYGHDIDGKLLEMIN
ncbi:MAG: hypothetical protein K5829_09660 [Treponema sp.]|nr:hypothetical protein [Treponema sp.]